MIVVRPFSARLRAALLTVALAVALCVPADAQLVTAVRGVNITVSDLDRAVDFYTRVLKFKKIAEDRSTGHVVEQIKGVPGARTRTARLQLGDESIALTEYLAPKGMPIPVDSRSNDGWFQHIAIIVRDMDKAYAWLRENRVRHVSSGPQRLPDWNKGAGGIKAFYFKDPDGHNLEILQFPAGKGDPKWQRPGDGLFLGIDHTAIVVADTDTSLRFYRDLFGLRVAGESENYGIEQERLNNVHGAKLRITALRAGSGPGIEFLEYLAPSDGRPYPRDAKASDILHWETVLAVADKNAAWQAAVKAKARLISSTPEFNKFLIKDPDGHTVALTQ
jgi:catechol 2,3-dioxygenase-like lactoylglutathione lyase family enzyme